MIRESSMTGCLGTMSQHELSLMRQRGIVARDSKAKRGEFLFMLPPGAPATSGQTYRPRSPPRSRSKHRAILVHNILRS
jgi:hypothetical protein